MKKHFFIFRHGQTDLNVRNVWQGCNTDALLNEKGKEQAKELQKRVYELQLTSLYSSPLLRAVQTARHIAYQGYHLDFTIKEDLRECNFGKAEGMTFYQVNQEYGKEFVDNFLFPTRDNWNEHFPYGESKHQVFDRVLRCLMQIFNENASKTDNRIGVVCHAGVISALQCGLGLQNVSYDNCSILHLSYDSETEKWTQIFD